MSEAPAVPLLGTLIDGRYRVERVVGSGGFGTVFSAFHVGLGSPVALKVLKLPPSLRPEELTKLCGAFFDEARTLKRLRHPNIVAALDVGLLPTTKDEAPLPYMVMEWCGGPTLKEYLANRGGRMTLDESWRLFEPLLDAMAHAHSEGVAHRDLKPANVLVDLGQAESGPCPRVVDFGIAKIVAPGEAAGSGDTQTVSGSSPFTPRYAAPEQLAGARTGPWTDVHALALLFFEMVTGRPAFGDDDNLVFALFDTTRPTPKSLGIEVGDLEPILARALSVRPADRYADAGALGEAMRAAADNGFGISAERPLMSLSLAETIAVASDRPFALSETPPTRKINPSVPKEVPSEISSLLRDISRAPLDTGERTGAPSSRTLRTMHGRSAPPKAASSSRARMVALSLLGAAAVATTLTVFAQRHRHAWPFKGPAPAAPIASTLVAAPSASAPVKMHLRDVTPKELERRLATAGFSACNGYDTADMHVSMCTPKSILYVSHVGIPSANLDDVLAFVNNIAANYAKSYGACELAVDGNVVVMLGAPEDRVHKAFDAVVDGLAFDARAVPPDLQKPTTPRSAAANLKLDGWNGNDLWASMAKLSEDISFVDVRNKPSQVVTLRDGRQTAVYLYTSNARYTLDSYRFNTAMGRFAYALDGETLLVVTGPPEHATLDYLKKLLDGAKAAETGSVVPRAAPIH